jgi:diguanylate cyclase (GGDEF)-like protein/PAS domain S-box-containing protein
MSFASEGVEALTGYSAAELREGEGWADIMRPEDTAAVELAVAESIQARRSFEISYGIHTKSKEVRWVSERGCCIYSQEGEPQFLEGVIRDISGRREAEELQNSVISRWRRTLDAIPQMVWTMAPDGSDEFFNSQWERFTGCKVANLRDLGDLDLVHVDDRVKAATTWNERLASGGLYEDQYRLRHVSGDYRWVLSRGEAERDERGRVVRWYGTCTDVHDQVTARELLLSSEALNRSIVKASPDSISLLDPAGIVRSLNPAALTALSTRSSADFVGRSWSNVFPLKARGPANRALAQAQAGRIARFTSSQPCASGTRWWDIVVAPIAGDAGEMNGLLSIARDITHQKTAEERVRWAAQHDPLTELPNRTLFQRVLDRALTEARDNSGAVTVLMLDLDDFKRTNDALGHDAGDALLTEFASRLRSAVRPDDMVARLGGDEFAVILRGVKNRFQVEAAVANISATLKVPFHFDGKLLDIKSSIGASISPEHGSTRSELMKHADIALYVAKGAGRGVLRVFEPAMRAEAQSRVSMLSLANAALKEELIRPFYQPKVDLRTGRLDGFEALLRWKHPINGMQAPDTIAAAFHDVELAAQISDRMIEKVMSDIRRWLDAGIQFGHVAINAAAAEFRRGDFAEKVLERLERSDLPASSLQLEVTETVFLGRGAEHVQDALKALSAEGIQIALDDFGTGYASLSHLNHFPVNVIKIDRSFISNLEKSDHDAAIVRAVINLGRSLGIKIVAEGIETDGQAEFLRRHRCHSGQGYIYSKALPAEAIPNLIAEWMGRKH